MFKLGVGNDLGIAYRWYNLLFTLFFIILYNPANAAILNKPFIHNMGSQGHKVQKHIEGSYQNGLNYRHQTWQRNSPSRVLAHQGAKVKGQEHEVQKHIEGDCVAGVSYALYCLPPLSNPVGVGRIFESVCLSVCLFVRSITQKRINPKCSNLV